MPDTDERRLIYNVGAPPNPDQLVRCTFAEYHAMRSALEQAERALALAADDARQPAHPWARPLQTSIGIARARIRRAR